MNASHANVVRVPASSATPETTLGPGVKAGGPLRVLLYSLAGAGEHYGGPGSSAFRLYRRANPDQLRVWLVHGSREQSDSAVFAGATRPRIFGGAPLDQVRYMLAVRTWMRQHLAAFDVFHGLQGFSATVNAALIAESRGVPAAIKLANHATDLTDKPGTLRGFLGVQRRRRRAIRRVSAIIAISRAIRDELLGYGFDPRQIVEIPNGVDTERFRPLRDLTERSRRRAELGWSDEPTVLFVGELSRRKRPHLIVEALASTKQPWRAIMMGPEVDPTYAAELKASAASHGVEDRLLWLGHVKQPDRYLPLCDVYCLPSSNEGMPNAMLEAMACGVPCIGTRISGIEDLIRDGETGQLVEPTVGAVVESLDAYSADEARRVGQGDAARTRVETGFSVDAVLKAHQALFARLLRGESANPSA